jgi:hypothetical protein
MQGKEVEYYKYNPDTLEITPAENQVPHDSTIVTIQGIVHGEDVTVGVKFWSSRRSLRCGPDGKPRHFFCWIKGGPFGGLGFSFADPALIADVRHLVAVTVGLWAVPPGFDELFGKVIQTVDLPSMLHTVAKRLVLEQDMQKKDQEKWGRFWQELGVPQGQGCKRIRVPLHGPTPEVTPPWLEKCRAFTSALQPAPTPPVPQEEEEVDEELLAVYRFIERMKKGGFRGPAT